jgi:hypothetical protein
MRKIIFASFPCKWAVIWAKCTVAWWPLSMTLKREFHSATTTD